MGTNERNEHQWPLYFIYNHSHCEQFTHKLIIHFRQNSYSMISDDLSLIHRLDAIHFTVAKKDNLTYM